MKRLWKTMCAALALAALLSCAAKKAEPLTKSGFLMDTIIAVTLYDSGDQTILDGAFDLCASYEHVFSRTDPESELNRLNGAGGVPVAVSRDLLAVLERAVYYAEITGGKFDVTVCPVSELWDFSAERPALPDAEALRRALAKVNWRNIVIEGDSVRLENGAQVDLGGIAKGYTADRVADYLRERGVNSAIIDLGGNIFAVGVKPDGSPFRIGVQKPFEQRNVTAGTLEAIDRSVVSSGVYERSFTLDGRLYHHILDPETGYPADTGLLGVTVVSEQSVDGDALSTALFLLGPEDGLALAQEMGVEAMFIGADGEERYTPGFTETLHYRPQ